MTSIEKHYVTLRENKKILIAFKRYDYIKKKLKIFSLESVLSNILQSSIYTTYFQNTAPAEICALLRTFLHFKVRTCHSHCLPFYRYFSFCPFYFSHPATWRSASVAWTRMHSPHLLWWWKRGRKIMGHSRDACGCGVSIWRRLETRKERRGESEVKEGEGGISSTSSMSQQPQRYAPCESPSVSIIIATGKA